MRCKCSNCGSYNITILYTEEVGCGGILYHYECEDCDCKFDENYH